MNKEQNKRYKKIEQQKIIQDPKKHKNEMSKKTKIWILIVTGVLALATIIGLVFLLSTLLKKAN